MAGNSRKNQKRVCFEIDTYKKAMNFIWAMRLSKAKERIAFILDYYPELRHLKQHELAELIGLERETVCRNLKHLKTEGG